MLLLAYTLGDRHCQIPSETANAKAKLCNHVELPYLGLECVNGENRAAPSDKYKKASILRAERIVRKPVTVVTKKAVLQPEKNEKILFLLASQLQISEIKQVKSQVNKHIVPKASYDFCYTMFVCGCQSVSTEESSGAPWCASEAS